jgi:AAA15 family ATPase/GTPase
MKYKSFYIKNFKGIKELTIELDKQPISNIITLVGLNESGKTTILEAINVLNNDINDKDVHKLIPKNRKFSFNDTIEVHATLEFDEKDEKTIEKFSKSLGFRTIQPFKYLNEKIVYKFKDSIYLDKDSESDYFCDFNLIGCKERERNPRKYNDNSSEFNKMFGFIYKELYPTIIYYPNFLFDFPNRIYLEKSDKEDKEQETYRRVLSDIMDTFNEGLKIEDHIINRLKVKNEGAQEALESTIERMSKQITDVVFLAWGQMFNSKGKEIRLKPGIDEKNGLAYLEVKLKEGTDQFQIAERSLGFKWFFTFLLFTEFRKNRSSEKGEILFLLDEPASNLHSTAQKSLLSTFEKLVSKSKMIYTTHSHHLINPKWLSGAYIVRNKALNYENDFDYNAKNTDIEAIPYKQFVVKHPEQKTYFQPILDAIEYSPSILEEVPNIILTEGKNDYYTFKYVNEVLLSNEFPDLKFYPGNGADRNNQIIATYLAWGRDFTILLDGDKPGLAAKERYKNEFGVIIFDEIITLKDIDVNFKFPTEGLFTKEEQLKIIHTFDPNEVEFNKSKFNSALQVLFIQEQKIELSKDTMSRFRKIFEFVK